MHGCVHRAHVIEAAVRSTRVDVCAHVCVRGCAALVRVCLVVRMCGCVCVRSFDGVNERASNSCVACNARANRFATLMHSSARRDKTKLSSAQAPHSPRLPLLQYPSPQPAAHHHHSTTITTFRRGIQKKPCHRKEKHQRVSCGSCGVWGVCGVNRCDCGLT